MIKKTSSYSSFSFKPGLHSTIHPMLATKPNLCLFGQSFRSIPQYKLVQSDRSELMRFFWPMNYTTTSHPSLQIAFLLQFSYHLNHDHLKVFSNMFSLGYSLPIFLGVLVLITLHATFLLKALCASILATPHHPLSRL